ncbi:MAG: hypothetical protein AAB909_00770, partial [Patescibacteria group bacterium]
VYALLAGLGDAFISGSREALLYDTLKQLKREGEFSKLSSKYGLIFQIGLAIGTLMGGFMSTVYFRLPILSYSLMLFISAIVSSFFVEPNIDSEKFTLKNYINKTRQGVGELTKNIHIKKVAIFYILVGGISWACQNVFNTSVLVELGYSNLQLGFILSTIRVTNGLVLFRLLNLGKYFNRQRAYLFFPILMMIALIPGIFLTKLFAVPFVAASMLASTARWIILGKYTNEEFESKNRATAISALSMAIGILVTIIIVASGPLVEILGGSRHIYTILGLITAVFVLPLGIDLAKNHSHDTRTGKALN